MNLRKLAGLLAGMGEYLPPMVRALLPKPVPAVEVKIITSKRGHHFSGNAHQRRVALRSSLPLASRSAKGTDLVGDFS